MNEASFPVQDANDGWDTSAAANFLPNFIVPINQL